MTTKVIGTIDIATGEIEYHARTDGEYSTLCGLAIDGDYHIEAPVPKRQKINCPQCYVAFADARAFRTTDFVV